MRSEVQTTARPSRGAVQPRPGGGPGRERPEKRLQQVYAIPVERGTKRRWWPPVWLAETLYCLFERVVALTALAVSLPALLVAAVAIKLDSRGPVLFLHRRVGRCQPRRGRDLMGRTDLVPPNGQFEPEKLYWVPRTFRLPKLRTLVDNAVARFPGLCWWESGIDPAQFESMYYKIEDDPRVTRAGRWLRRTTIDELPNFWSVLLGQIRLVGPRPEAPKILRYYSPQQMKKFTVKPGITCLSKVCGRGKLTVGEQITLDLQYVRNRSLRLDLKILLLTARTVLTGEGAF